MKPIENQIEIYQSSDGHTKVEVKFEQDNIWLNQKQLAQLFDKDSDTIGLHFKNIFNEGELEEESTTEEFSVVQKEGKRNVRRKIKFYNLDAIISVGYRVNSKRGTQFRQWATQRLKDYLVQGYAINEHRLAQKQQEVYALKDGIRILSRVIEEKAIDMDFPWLHYFAKGLELLDDYDHEQLDQKGVSTQKATYPELADYRKIVEAMKSEFESAVFGKEKDDSFQSSVAQIGKGFDNEDFYPSIEEKGQQHCFI